MSAGLGIAPSRKTYKISISHLPSSSSRLHPKTDDAALRSIEPHNAGEEMDDNDKGDEDVWDRLGR